MQARQYPFLDSDVSGIFYDLLEANLIDLPEMKWSEEAEWMDDPKYCKYHHLVGHTIQDCFVFKGKVMQLARQGKISPKAASAVTNAITIKSGYFDGNKDACKIAHGDDTASNEVHYSKRRIPLMLMTECPQLLSLTKICFLGLSLIIVLCSLLDVKAFYNMLLDRPWLHENVIVPSAWHQCFKYCPNGIVKKVLNGNKPFTEVESHFVNAKYYIEGAKKEKEVFPSEEPKLCGNQNTRKNGSSTIKVELSKDLTLPLTQIKLK
ncbi:UNVERIFIED_CONTAM: hypothetical protein Slati_3071700 [Sesamum latifolium]|uniref:Uncharacterized protein n=1 Tax=Sesamum latifolium TaxID=2727402 RepID=A0AAW2UTZ4_9LAMI